MQPSAAEEIGQVIDVIDGDTIDVSIAGQTFRVRYIGVNTPESDQPCYQEATAGNAVLVSGQMVRLTKDVSEVDRFGRLLRYVFVGDVLVNSELVRQGYAEAKEYPPDTMHAAYLESLETEAQAANLNCYATGVFSDAGAPAPTQMIAPGATLGGNCDAAYPTVCIPAPPPDLNCSDVPYTNFRALAPDPHHFDGNGDGVACER